MTTLQFSLFFVALLVGYILVHIRLARFEEHMQKLSGIRLLDDRVKLMAESLDKLTVEGVESRLDSLRESLEVLAEVTARMQEAMSQAAQPAATTVVAAGGAVRVVLDPQAAHAEELVAALAAPDDRVPGQVGAAVRAGDHVAPPGPAGPVAVAAAGRVARGGAGDGLQAALAGAVALGAQA